MNRPTRNSHFRTGFSVAHLIAEGSYEEALSVLVEAGEYNRSDGGNPDYQTMLEGYIGLTRILSGDVEAGEMEFGSAVSTLESRRR